MAKAKVVRISKYPDVLEAGQAAALLKALVVMDAIELTALRAWDNDTEPMRAYWLGELGGKASAAGDALFAVLSSASIGCESASAAKAVARRLDRDD